MKYPNRTHLTPAETRVIERIAEGQRDKEIAEQLGVSPYTVQTQVRTAMRVLGARSRAHAVAIHLRKTS